METDPPIQNNIQPVTTNPQPEVIVKPKTADLLEPKNLLIILVFFVSSFVVGLLTAKYYTSYRHEDGYKLTGENIDTPVPLELLQNPMLSNWSARVEGQVINKEDQSFIIAEITREFTSTGSATVKRVENNKFLNIVYIDEKTKILEVLNPDAAFEGQSLEVTEINLADLALDTFISGNVELYRTLEDQWYLVGRDFTIQKL